MLDPLAAQRLRHLAGGLLRREDERDPAAEDPLEDRPDQRVVRAAEDHGVDVCGLERLGVLADGVGRLGPERGLALDQRHEAGARDREKPGAGVERLHELAVAAGVHRRLGREQADPAVARRLDGRVRLGRDHADHRQRQLLLELRQRRRRRGVAGDEDQLDALALHERGDLAGEAADLVERARPVRQARVVAEVDEVLVRHRHETLVQDGQAADARVEDADGTGIHGAGLYGSGVGRLLAAALAAFVFAAPARAFTKDDLLLPMSDGVDVAATLYFPDGPAPPGGWPAIIALHGLGQTRAASNVAAEAAFAPNGYAVLTVDARGHGESGGLNDVDGPRAIQDVRELFAWLTARPDVDGQRVGAFGTSLGGGAVWRAAAEGVPFAAIVPVSAWTDLYRALYPGNLAKSGAVLGFLSEIPADHFAPVVTELRNDLLRSTSLDRVRALARERSSAHLLDRVSAPALVVQGRRDFAFDLTEARAALRGLQGPKRLYLGDLGHPPATNPPAEVPHLLGLARAWFDRWLKLLPNGIDAGGRVELAPDPWTGRTYRYPGLPPMRSLRLSLPGRKTIGPSGVVVRTVRLPRRLHETFGAPLVRVRRRPGAAGRTSSAP